MNIKPIKTEADYRDALGGLKLFLTHR